MDTPCTKGQKLYDEKRSKGTLGHLEVRPTCDRNGLYDPYTCIPGEMYFVIYFYIPISFNFLILDVIVFPKVGKEFLEKFHIAMMLNIN